MQHDAKHMPCHRLRTLNALRDAELMRDRSQLRETESKREDRVCRECYVSLAPHASAQLGNLLEVSAEGGLGEAADPCGVTLQDFPL